MVCVCVSLVCEIHNRQWSESAGEHTLVKQIQVWSCGLVVWEDLFKKKKKKPIL